MAATLLFASLIAVQLTDASTCRSRRKGELHAAEYSAWLEEAGFRHIETVWFDARAAKGAAIGRKP
jgi:hypothetical protein